MMVANVALVLVSLFVGWAALWPARGRLGGWAYHLAALPVGLLAWPLTAALADVISRPLGPKLAPIGLLLFALFGSAISYLAVRGESDRGREGGRDGDALRERDAGPDGDRRREGRPRPRPRPASYIAWAFTVAAVASAAALAGATMLGFDSVFHYHSWGVWLRDTGRSTPDIVGAYGPLLPSLHAGTMALGGGWTYVVYPMMAFSVLALLAFACLRSLPASLPRWARAVILLGTVLLVASTSPFLYHTLYVHSHMASALYLLLAVIAVHEAFWRAESGTAAWGVIAGAAAAGLALARADGLAYAFVVLVAAAVGYLARPETAPSVRALFGAYASVLGVVYLDAFAHHGLWESRKLTGTMALAVLAATAVFIAATLAAPASRSARTLFADVRTGTLAVVSLEVTAVAVLLAWQPDRLARTVYYMSGNLSLKGGQGFLWYSIVGLIVLSLGLVRSAAGLERAARLLLLSLATFGVVALAVHGLTHPGRIAPADSFNRVTFHVVPLAFWYGAIVSGRVAAVLLATREQGEHTEPPE